MKTKTKACQILQLPDHIFVEIFCKIPTTTLFQCRCVCKSWHSYFKDPQFTKELLSRTVPSLSSSLLIYAGPTLCNNSRSNPRNPKPEGYFFCLVDFDKVASRSPHNVAIKPPKDLKVSFCVEIVGSCNGLICLDDLACRFYISNPMTCESLLLPVPIDVEKIIDAGYPIQRFGFPYVSGFGFSPISNVYKLLFIYKLKGSDIGEAMVLTVGSGIWRSIGNSVYPKWIYPPYMTYLNGFLHWAVLSDGNSLLIYAFDLESEQFQQLPTFDYYFQPSHNKFNLGVLGGCLSLVVQNCGIWIMKDYGVKGSWTQEYAIYDPVHGHILSTSRVLKLTEEEDEVLVFNQVEDQLLAYAPRTRKLRRVKVDGLPSSVVMIQGACDYIPNFVSLNNIISG